MTTLTQRMNVVEENLQSIRLTLDTLLQNLLNPALMVPGTLRFGGNTMQLDQHGIQVATNGATVPALYFVDTLTAIPDDDTSTPSKVMVRGKVDPTASEEESFFQVYPLYGGNVGPQFELIGATLTGHVITLRAGRLELSEGYLTPAQIGSNQDNYSPTGLNKAHTLRLSTDASRDITGITGGADGRVLFIFNVGGFNIVLKNDVTSTAANRFLFPADITLAPNEGIGLMYDETSDRWRCFGRY